MKLDASFAPGTEPARLDDWEVAGRVTLPDEYAAWARVGLRATPPDVPVGGLAAQVTTSTRAAVPPDDGRLRAAPAVTFHIVSPLDGDRYAVPPGVDARFATVALRAAGPGAERVRWSVDGASQAGERWALLPGEHVVRAVSARGEAAEVRIVVDR